MKGEAESAGQRVPHDARLLILDEPAAGLDVVAREELLDLLREFMERDEKRAILISFPYFTGSGTSL